jgi:hypothetical protein
MNAFQRCLSKSIAVKCYVFTQTCLEALSENFENYLPPPQILKTLSWICMKGECKVYPIICHKGREGECNSTLSLTSALVGMGGQRHILVALPPRNEPVPTVYDAGWAPGPFWTGAEILARIGIRSL